ncbi:MAG: hypothetical protein D6741_15830, partial [Planctomycetota bacterium]
MLIGWCIGVVAGCSYIVVGARPAAARESTDEFVVEVHHPGMGENPVACTVTIERDTKGDISGYHVQVLSVFCINGVCRAVPVQLFWDPLGNYERFTVKPGMHLEKADGKPFTDADYRKLDTILADPDSPLRNLDAFVFPEHSGTTMPADAVSSPTPVVYEGAVVEGAAWTCFTLWHWVHGPLREELRKTTAAAWTPDDIADVLEDGSE